MEIVDQDGSTRVDTARQSSSDTPATDSLWTLVLKLALVFGACLAATLSLCSLLLQRVREEDAHRGLSTSRLDQLSIKSFSSLVELQRSHETFAHIFAVQFPLALLCFACVYVMKQVRGEHKATTLPFHPARSLFLIIPSRVSVCVHRRSRSPVRLC